MEASSRRASFMGEISLLSVAAIDQVSQRAFISPKESPGDDLRGRRITITGCRQDVGERPQQGAVAAPPQPAIHRGGPADRRRVQRVECLRRSESAAQRDGADLQARLSHIRSQC